ncbi:hypothetical protein [Acuticoccus sp.]
MKTRIVVDRAALDEPPFPQQGGFHRIDKAFKGSVEDVLRDVADATWEVA